MFRASPRTPVPVQGLGRVVQPASHYPRYLDTWCDAVDDELFSSIDEIRFPEVIKVD